MREEGISKRPAVKEEEPPELHSDLLWVWNIYAILNSQRQVAQHGPQPLTLSDIKAVADMKGFTSLEECNDILKFIPELDREYLRSWHEEQEKANKKRTPKKT